METGPERLGKLLKERRKALDLTLENVEAATIKFGQRVSAGFLSDTERAYPREGGNVTLPSDEKMRALSHVLGIPARDLHAALGRVPPGSPASQLVREKLAAYNEEGQIAPAVLDDLSSEVDDFAQVRVERVMRQAVQLAPINASQPKIAGQPKISQEAMKNRATRLTRETRARDPRVRRSEAIVWALDLDGRFLMSEGDELEQAHLRPGQAVGLHIWDVYQGEDEFLEKVQMTLASDGPLEWTTTVRGTAWRCMTEPLRDAQGTKIGIVGASLVVPTISEAQKQG